MATLSKFPFGGTDPAKSPAIWEGVLDEAARSDPRYGNYWETHFNAIADDQVTVTALNSGASEGFAKLASAGGVRSLVATTAADHRGAQVLIPALGSFQVTDGGVLAIEFTVDLFRCSTFFIGLVEDGLTILDASSDLPTNASYVGFSRKNGGVVNFTARDDDGGGDTTDTEQVLAADYYHKLAAGESEPTRLGFKIHGGNNLVIAVDGTPYKTPADDFDLSALPSGEVLTIGLAAARGEDQDEDDVRLDADFVAVYNRT